MQVLQGLREQRAGRKTGLTRFLFGDFDLNEDQVIEGNIGSTIKMDYTLRGDPVNRAARLESLTRTLRRAMAISGSIRQRAKQPWPFECVGEFRLQ